eukprot:7708161-Pyramimonas_sp.AAC.1
MSTAAEGPPPRRDATHRRIARLKCEDLTCHQRNYCRYERRVFDIASTSCNLVSHVPQGVVPSCTFAAAGSTPAPPPPPPHLRV